MRARLNLRQERFCQLLKQGIPPYRAYPQAGYQPHHDSPYRLRDNAGVQHRLAEITKGLAMQTRVTVASITAELEEDRAFARSIEQAGPALNATLAKAKLHGLIVDRKESGQPGDFAALQTADAVLALVRQELGEDAASALAGLLMAKTAAPMLELEALEQDATAEPSPLVSNA